jgi:hypothetical protein
LQDKLLGFRAGANVDNAQVIRNFFCRPEFFDIGYHLPRYKIVHHHRHRNYYSIGKLKYELNVGLRGRLSIDPIPVKHIDAPVKQAGRIGPFAALQL